jgi:hypothetical protein
MRQGRAGVVRPEQTQDLANWCVGAEGTYGQNDRLQPLRCRHPIINLFALRRVR